MSEKQLMHILDKVTTMETEFKQALFELHEMGLETNKALAETNKSLAETNKVVAEMNKVVMETHKVVMETNKALAETNKVATETNATVNRIEIIQEQQHHIIDLLSTRSIEQKATLKRIK